MAKRKTAPKTYDPVVGQTIVGLRRSTEAELRKHLWSDHFDVLMLKNGNGLFVYGDDEGNYPGYFDVNIYTKSGGWKSAGELNGKWFELIDGGKITALYELGYTYEVGIKPTKEKSEQIGVIQVVLDPMPGGHSHQKFGVLTYVSKSGNEYSLTFTPKMSPREMMDRGLM